jgi:predicted transposase YbfD/YdcC
VVLSQIARNRSFALSQCVTALFDVDEDAAWSALVSSLEQGLGADGVLDGDFAARDLLAHFQCIPDRRQTAWVEHPLAVVLALAAGAVVAGIRSFTAIAGWIEDAPTDLLTCLYVRCQYTVPLGPPSKTTLWRLVTDVDADALDLAIGAWPLSRATAQHQAAPEQVTEPAPQPAPDCDTEPVQRLIPLAVDGKVARGSKDETGKQVRLLAAMLHDKRLVLNQVPVGAKTNEIPMLQPLLDPLDITDHVITADSLHTQRKTARYLHGRDAHFLLQVKGNQPKLFTALDALPWRETPIGHTATTKAHGRITTRTLQVRPAPKDLNFPHVHQVFLIERQITDLKGKSLSNVAVLGVTDLTANQADATVIAEFTLGQWGLESLHWLRDTLYREDDSKISTRSGPRAMAALRNLAIGAHQLNGRTDITEATRWACRDRRRPFKILGLDH